VIFENKIGARGLVREFKVSDLSLRGPTLHTRSMKDELFGMEAERFFRVGSEEKGILDE